MARKPKPPPAVAKPKFSLSAWMLEDRSALPSTSTAPSASRIVARVALGASLGESPQITAARPSASPTSPTSPARSSPDIAAISTCAPTAAPSASKRCARSVSGRPEAGPCIQAMTKPPSSVAATSGSASWPAWSSPAGSAAETGARSAS